MPVTSVADINVFLTIFSFAFGDLVKHGILIISKRRLIISILIVNLFLKEAIVWHRDQRNSGTKQLEYLGGFI